MISSDGSVIVAVAYNKSARTNLVGWAGVMVTSVANTNTQSGLVPVVTINPATACAGYVAAGAPLTGSATLVTGSPLVFVETGAVAKILQVPAKTPLGVAIANTAVLDNYVPMPRGAVTAMALVVQEIPPLKADPFRAAIPPDPATGPNPANGLYGPYTGTPLTVSPAITWKVSQTGAR
jgi:hypothetical protein